MVRESTFGEHASGHNRDRGWKKPPQPTPTDIHELAQHADEVREEVDAALSFGWLDLPLEVIEKSMLPATIEGLHLLHKDREHFTLFANTIRREIAKKGFVVDGKAITDQELGRRFRAALIDVFGPIKPQNKVHPQAEQMINESAAMFYTVMRVMLDVLYVWDAGYRLVKQQDKGIDNEEGS